MKSKKRNWGMKPLQSGTVNNQGNAAGKKYGSELSKMSGHGKNLFEKAVRRTVKRK